MSISLIQTPCNIEPYLPQSGRMCLLDTLLKVDDESLEASVVPTDKNEFATDQGIPGWIGLEWMAQAIAAWSGVQASAVGREPTIGFLLGTRHYKCRHPWLTIGANYTVRVELDFQAENGLGSFMCCIFDIESTETASAQVNVFQPEAKDLPEIQKKGFK